MLWIGTQSTHLVALVPALLIGNELPDPSSVLIIRKACYMVLATKGLESVSLQELVHIHVADYT